MRDGESDSAAASRLHRDRHSTNAQALSPLQLLSWDGESEREENKWKRKRKQRKRKSHHHQPSL